MLRLSCLAALMLLGAAAPEPPRPEGAVGEGVVREAEEHVRAGRARAAIDLVRAALPVLRGGPHEAPARWWLAVALRAEGRGPHAYNELLRVRRLDPALHAARGGPALERELAESLGLAAEVPLPRGVAQVFVLPKLTGGTRQHFARLAAAGLDLVVLRAFHAEGDRPHEEATLDAQAGVYFATEHLEVVADRLADDCSAARAAGLRCYGWMTTLDTPAPGLLPRHGDVEWDFRAGRYRPSGRLDLFDPAVVALLEDVYRDLARAGVDGVLLQDDLMLRQLEGFSDRARRAWKKETGSELDPLALVEVVGDGTARRVRYREEFWRFARFKRDRLLDLAERLQAAAREVNPRFEMALNLAYEAALNEVGALAWMAQDLEEAARRDFRWLAIMAYHRQVQHELGLAGEAEVIGALERMAGRLSRVAGAKERVLVKLQTIDWRNRDPVPAAELARVAAPFRGFTIALAPADDAGRVADILAALSGEPPGAQTAPAAAMADGEP